MDEIKSVIAKNITQLRLAKGMTQIELAEKLNYSDKAVSKWERGESIPDVSVLMHIADIFSVTLDYLVHPHKDADERGMKLRDANRKKNHIFITSMCILLVWLIATIAFVVMDMIPVDLGFLHGLSFVYAIPASTIVWLVFNAVWFNRRRNYIIISILMWTVLISLHVSFLPFGFNFWIMYVLGIPGQIIIFLWSRLKYPKQKTSVKYTRKQKNSQIQ
ncbi:MAG: helix-turn-helix transcriptional regulator [Clostridia bacterium]|nr:helix-turn-helix transcriptional regulator [Clostridia bacterium]